MSPLIQTDMVMRDFHIWAASIVLLSAGSTDGGPVAPVTQTGAPPIAAAAIDTPETRPVSAPPLTAAGHSTIRRSTDGLFYVTASVGGDTVRFLVDTGANITVLTRADADRLGLAGNNAGNRGSVLQTAGGPTTMRWTKIPKMSVANKPVTDVDAAIIDQGITVSLLGQNVLSRLDGMTFSGDQLQFH